MVLAKPMLSASKACWYTYQLTVEVDQAGPPLVRT